MSDCIGTGCKAEALMAENAALKEEIKKHVALYQTSLELAERVQAENAALRKLADDRLEQMNADRKQYLNAQHRIKVLQSVLTTIRDRFFPENQPERDRDLSWDTVNSALATPDNTAEIDALVRDAERLNWLESNPRHAQIMIDGKATDCVFYGISCAKLVKLRDAIDAAMKETPNG